ncbi:helix-turn-helix domain-containing protein [Paraburkholderia rhizosphaerae]|uniref:AraC family transcriptional regulator n=1 Tax=Paraburkholderia rhizosphaerae TaxID=480658 RepID=A0A4R8LQG0_9BURK|nr:helix-turn-helix domain-containing protein [Paraburkholderia rhizosphaerae]TDY49789.1 AraC family transcriptional regulator [Paraburkholderia rhizosphaerae]
MTTDSAFFQAADSDRAVPTSLQRHERYRVQTRIAHDADEQARNLYGWRQTYDQLTSGRFTGELTGLHVDDMHVFREATSQTLRQICEVRSDACWFGIPVRREGVTGQIDGNVIDADAFALKPGGVEFELMTPAGYEIFGVVVSGDVLRRHAALDERAGRALLDHGPPTGVMPIDAASKTQLGVRLMQILGEERAALDHRARHQLHASVLDLLLDACGGGASSPGSERVAISRQPRRRGIVSDARDYVLANRDRPVSVPELCEHLHVSRRTLQYCFEDVLGMAPASYLRVIRLNGARRDLCDASRGSSARSVQDVAAAWGFWHLSQFATDYRKLFGIRPSDTLRATRSGLS